MHLWLDSPTEDQNESNTLNVKKDSLSNSNSSSEEDNIPSTKISDDSINEDIAETEPFLDKGMMKWLIL